MLRLVDFQFARRGIYLKGYAYLARDTEDYTVRAAAAAGAEPLPGAGIYLAVFAGAE